MIIYAILSYLREATKDSCVTEQSNVSVCFMINPQSGEPTEYNYMRRITTTTVTMDYSDAAPADPSDDDELGLDDRLLGFSRYGNPEAEAETII